MIHLGGCPGKFFITGLNARHVDLALLNHNLLGMAKLSPLHGYVFEIVPGGDDIAIVGAAVNALSLTVLPERASYFRDPFSLVLGDLDFLGQGWIGGLTRSA